MTLAKTASGARTAPSSANITTCRNPCGASAASIGTCSGGVERRRDMTKDQAQVEQIQKTMDECEAKIAMYSQRGGLEAEAKVCYFRDLWEELKIKQKYYLRRCKDD